MDNHETEAMYLKAVYMLQRERGHTRAIDIVNRVGRTRATVSQMLKRLKEKGYIRTCEDGGVCLTQSGTEKAAAVIEAYQLLRQLLLRLGADEQMAEENACRMERVISAEAVEALRAYFRRDPPAGPFPT